MSAGFDASKDLPPETPGPAGKCTLGYSSLWPVCFFCQLGLRRRNSSRQASLEPVGRSTSAALLR
jgi:hypothetical protein